MKKLTAVLLIATLLLSICPQVFAATFNWVTQNPIVCNSVYDYSEFGIIVNDQNRNMGLIGTNGNMIVPFEKGYKELSFADFQQGLIAFVDSNNRAGVMDLNGNVVVQAGLYEKIVERVDDYVYIVAKKGAEIYPGYFDYEYGLGDVNGNLIIPYGLYNEIRLDGWYGTVTVRTEEYKSGVYTSAGQPVIPVEYGYDEIYATGSPYRYVAGIDGKYFLVDNAANTLAELPGYVSNSYEIDNYIVSMGDSNGTIYDLNGNVIGAMSEDAEFIGGKYIHDFSNNMVSDISGNIIVAPNVYTKMNFIDDTHMAVENTSGECALIDINGNVLMPFGSFQGVYYVGSIYDGKYMINYNYIKDVYGNILAEVDDYINYMGNGYFYTEEYSYNEIDYTSSVQIKIGRAEGEGVAPAAPVASSIGVVVNGMPVQFTDQAPVIVDGRTLLPLRAVFDLLGATIEWEAETQTVYAKRGNVDITLTIGSDQLWVNGQPKTLDVRAQIMNGRTMVPVRAVADAFGCGIDWNAATSTVIITTN
ncbi:MAG: copper amine oxidase N-terminal domain-containing protein [Clostridia bacterium]|nr:copper amine oxidase N-terminal domain-containing protein [Clostridia bacterium]